MVKVELWAVFFLQKSRCMLAQNQININATSPYDIRLAEPKEHPHEVTARAAMPKQWKVRILYRYDPTAGS
jgi:hypothetical protein